MNILISGSTGFLGTALVSFLTERGHEVRRLLRNSKNKNSFDLIWDPEKGLENPKSLEGIEVVIHLSGENVGERWSDQKKRLIRESRVHSTQTLAQHLAKMKNPPQTFLCASAIGFYGDRKEEELTEESPAGSGFLAEVCQEWEAASAPVVSKGSRVAHLRFGVILDKSGGALEKMLTPFKLGVGGVLGNGNQFMSWIALEDVLRAIEYVIQIPVLAGPINFTSPHPVTNREFTHALGHALHRPAVLSVPAFALRLAFGEMADEALLASARVLPKKLLDAEFQFEYPYLEKAFEHLFKDKTV